MTNPTVKIENFSIENELSCRCGCKRYSYSDEFLIRLQAFRYKYGKSLSITSGGRCLKHNISEGGVVTSLHECQTKKASATDVTGDCKSIYQDACLSGLFNEVEWHKNDGKNFVHLGWDSKQKGTDFKII